MNYDHMINIYIYKYDMSCDIRYTDGSPDPRELWRADLWAERSSNERYSMMMHVLDSLDKKDRGMYYTLK